MDNSESQTSPTMTMSDGEHRWVRLIGTICLGLAPFLKRVFPNVWRRLSRSLLHGVAYLGDEGMLLRLLAMGVDPNIREDMLKSTPLMSAMFTGNIRIAELLLHAGADVNAKEEYGGTALMRAAEFGHSECVAFLLNVGAEINATERSFGHTALSRAAWGGHLDTVRLLVERGADIHAPMRCQLTIAEWARRLAGSRGPRREAVLACADYLEQR